MAKHAPAGNPRLIGRAQGVDLLALLGTADANESTEYLHVSLDQLSEDPTQPRRTWDSHTLEAMAASLRKHGVLQPLLVRRSDTPQDGRAHYIIVSGGRRYRGARQAGLDVVPVRVCAPRLEDVALLQLVENIEREDLSPVDEATALRQIMTLGGLSVYQMGACLHRTHTYVADRLQLLKHSEIANAVQRGGIAASVATAIAREPDPAERARQLREALAGRLTKRSIQNQRARGAPMRRAAAADRAPSAQVSNVGLAPAPPPALRVAPAVCLQGHLVRIGATAPILALLRWTLAQGWSITPPTIWQNVDLSSR